jgi:hypothetical protein
MHRALVVQIALESMPRARTFPSATRKIVEDFDLLCDGPPVQGRFVKVGVVLQCRDCGAGIVVQGLWWCSSAGTFH